MSIIKFILFTFVVIKNSIQILNPRILVMSTCGYGLLICLQGFWPESEPIKLCEYENVDGDSEREEQRIVLVPE